MLDQAHLLIAHGDAVQAVGDGDAVARGGGGLVHPAQIGEASRSIDLALVTGCFAVGSVGEDGAAWIGDPVAADLGTADYRGRIAGVLFREIVVADRAYV